MKLRFQWEATSSEHNKLDYVLDSAIISTRKLQIRITLVAEGEEGTPHLKGES